MNSTIDSLTQQELETYQELRKRHRHITTGCYGCDSEQSRQGNNTALCQTHEQDYKRYLESR